MMMRIGEQSLARDRSIAAQSTEWTTPFLSMKQPCLDPVLLDLPPPRLPFNKLHTKITQRLKLLGTFGSH